MKPDKNKLKSGTLFSYFNINQVIITKVFNFCNLKQLKFFDLYIGNH